MKIYRAALIGCSRMGAFIDNEVPPERRPYSHAAGYEACARTDLVACSDLREDVMAKVGERYSVPEHRRYVDYHELLERERPDIVSGATQPEQRAEIVIAAVESGARAIYAEKAFSASMEEADRMVGTCASAGVPLSCGAITTTHPSFARAKELLHRWSRVRLLAPRSWVGFATGCPVRT